MSLFVVSLLRSLPVAVTVGAAAFARPVTLQDDLEEAVTAWAEPFVQRQHFAGTLLVLGGEEVLVHTSFGLASVELRVPNTTETRYLIASISKPITGMIATQLVEEGALDVAATIDRWVPEIPRAKEITVGHLLGHASGLRHRVTTAEQESQPISAAQMVAHAAATELLFDPGTGEEYSSAGYSVLARVLELVTGQSYGELLRTRICEPAGLERTVHPADHAPIPGRAQSYLPAADGLRNAPPKHYSFLVGAGSIFSTPMDLHRLVQAARRGDLGDGAAQRFGHGRAISWNGLSNGYTATYRYDPRTEVTVAFAGNIQSGARDVVLAAVERLVLGAEVAPPPELPAPVAVPVAKLAQYEGLYNVRPGFDTRLTVIDDALCVDGEPLVPLGDDTFLWLRQYARLTFVRDDTGAMERVDWVVGEEVYPCPRVGDA